ncbi:MAG: beta-N-acetylhexosaminidase [Acidobacteria bacterium]|nr:MAG: beta-N-acetylhexosaminidase [Acidobacteriota bacterium]
MRTLLIVVSAFLLSTFFAAAQMPSTPALMPVPAKLQMGSGQLVIDQLFTVAVNGARDARLDSGISRFLDQLSRQTGMPLLKQPADTAKASLVIHCENAGRKIQELSEDEAYTLEVTPTQATLTAPNTLGALHGLQTFLQLIEVTPAGFAVPALTIQDQPRFAWRGLLIDVCRHFLPLDVMRRNLDGMAALKMNVLHWHLSDDEGFRVESRKFPKLHEMGSQGQYYTQAEIREFVSYARDRGIRVVPEFEMPGHSRSIVVGYPDLASQPGTYPPGRVAGDATALDVTQEKTYKFLDKLIEEMAGLFPDAYFHIGGDEVDDKPWNSNPKIQEFIHAHGMKDNRDLQAYFNKRLERMVSKHGKIMMGWDEILHPDLPKNVVVQSWRGQESLAAAAKQGYRGLLSNGYYLDLMWPAARHYAVDPMSGAAAALTPEEAKLILGGEACMWAEYITPETIDSRIWPRLAPIAERFWSPQNVTDPKSMYQRLDEISWRLGWLGLTHESNYLPMLRRLAGAEDVRSLRVLADAVEPTKDYTRSEVFPQPPVQSVSLNRLVDAARPESATARHFAELVGSFVASGYKDSASEAQIRAWLVKWQGNHTNLKPLMERSFLLTEDLPLSEDLVTLSAACLQAIDALAKNQTLPDSWRTEQLAVVERSMKPRANLLIMIAPSIQKMIEAASPPASHP